jgi:hypothetical protein
VIEELLAKTVYKARKALKVRLVRKAQRVTVEYQV